MREDTAPSPVSLPRESSRGEDEAAANGRPGTRPARAPRSEVLWGHSSTRAARPAVAAGGGPRAATKSANARTSARSCKKGPPAQERGCVAGAMRDDVRSVPRLVRWRTISTVALSRRLGARRRAVMSARARDRGALALFAAATLAATARAALAASAAERDAGLGLARPGLFSHTYLAVPEETSEHSTVRLDELPRRPRAPSAPRRSAMRIAACARRRRAFSARRRGSRPRPRRGGHRAGRRRGGGRTETAGDAAAARELSTMPNARLVVRVRVRDAEASAGQRRGCGLAREEPALSASDGRVPIARRLRARAGSSDAASLRGLRLVLCVRR